LIALILYMSEAANKRVKCNAKKRRAPYPNRWASVT
jgi:hypothetical protein